jgi:hypothetical protein
MRTFARLPWLLVPCLLCFSILPVAGAWASTGWSLDGSLRLRGECLADSHRLLSPGDECLTFARTEIALAYIDADWSFTAEVQDSRAWGDSPLSPIGTDDVNVLEPLQLWLGRRADLAGGELDLRVGRMTLDYGSRRLLARNNFRNTSNAFQGVWGDWRRGSASLQGFYTYALQRAPDSTDRAALRDNRFQLDRAGRAERFAGVSAGLRDAQRAHWSAYLLHLYREGRGGRPASLRDIFTAGGRVEAARGTLSADLEAAYQWGEAGRLPVADAARLDHRAWFMHASLRWELRAGLAATAAYDRASGDRDPADGRFERFDRLYGARAFELGPSGIFGVALRSNLRAPALRIDWSVGPDLTLLVAHRWLRLDAARDGLLSTGRVDVSGASGRDVGGQWEMRGSWSPSGSALAVEVGAAWLDKGRYFRGSEEAGVLNPPTPQPTDSRYLYGQVSYSF